MHEKSILLEALTPEQTYYLIRRGVDIFGLIEEGWAVNETTLNKIRHSLTPWQEDAVIGIVKNNDLKNE